MRYLWDDLNARARGLGSRLLSHAQFETLARSESLAALAANLRRAGLPVEPEGTSPQELELAARRMAASHLRVVRRWIGGRSGVLVVIFEDEDRRSLRALVRGAAASVPATVRLAGLMPTATLPERALQELAGLPTVAAVATLLLVWNNPYGRALREASTGSQPNLFKIDTAVNRLFAERATRAARSAGSDTLAAHVRETIDIENVCAALVLSAGREEVVPREAFLAGGRRLPFAAFERAIAAGSPPVAARELAVVLAGDPLAAVLQRGELTALESAVLRLRIAALQDVARRSPLGPATFLAYALRVRAQLLDLSRVIWGVAFAVPAPQLADRLVMT